MACFTDTAGDQWSITITIGTAQRVKEATQFELLKLYVPEQMLKLAEDPLLLAEVLCTVCAPQICERELTVEQFLDRLGGGTFEAAVEALADGVAEFYPEKKRELLKGIKQKSTQLQNEALDQASEKLQSLSLSSLSGA